MGRYLSDNIFFVSRLWKTLFSFKDFLFFWGIKVFRVFFLTTFHSTFVTITDTRTYVHSYMICAYGAGGQTNVNSSFKQVSNKFQTSFKQI